MHTKCSLLFCLVFLISSELLVVFLNPAGSYLHHMYTNRYELTLRHQAAHLEPAKTTWKRFSLVYSCVTSSLIKPSSIVPKGPKPTLLAGVCAQPLQMAAGQVHHNKATGITGRERNSPAWMDSSPFFSGFSWGNVKSVSW